MDLNHVLSSPSIASPLAGLINHSLHTPGIATQKKVVRCSTSQEFIAAKTSPDFDIKKEFKAFDDSKVGVKGLLDAGVENIPRIFIHDNKNIINKHDDDQLFKKSKLHFQIPIIDMSGVNEEGALRAEITEKISNACKTWGFFQIVNSGIPTPVMDRMLEGIRLFHEQDAEIKKQFYTRDRTKRVIYNSNFFLYESQAVTWKDTILCKMAPVERYDYVTKHNSMANSTYALSLNAFADLTHHEFKARYLGLSAAANNLIRLSRGSSSLGGAIGGNNDLPSSLDWTKKGAVTNVKDQGSCGACWAFSATGAIEGINKIATGSLVSLSEQELIDCDRSYNSGCGGGLMDYSYEFVVKNGGIDTEEDYPFEGRERTCNSNKLNRHVVTIDGYKDVPPNNEQELLQAVATQPVSVGICGSERAFQLYSGGIFTGPCSTSLDHAVLIVGYDSKNGVDYWIVKNSWGTSWGMNGYIHMVRNSSSSEGLCGINMLASYPLKTSANPPPSPPPGPTRCNLFSSCSGGETCCCSLPLLGICLSWKCCDLESAVCCKDHRHCCPQDYPICDTKRSLCLKRMGNSTLVKQLQNGEQFGDWSSLFANWNF